MAFLSSKKKKEKNKKLKRRGRAGGKVLPPIGNPKAEAVLSSSNSNLMGTNYLRLGQMSGSIW